MIKSKLKTQKKMYEKEKRIKTMDISKVYGIENHLN
jgi:hypothetical protein